MPDLDIRGRVMGVDATRHRDLLNTCAKLYLNPSMHDRSTALTDAAILICPGHDIRDI